MKLKRFGAALGVPRLFFWGPGSLGRFWAGGGTNVGRGLCGVWGLGHGGGYAIGGGGKMMGAGSREEEGRGLDMLWIVVWSKVGVYVLYEPLSCS